MAPFWTLPAALSNKATASLHVCKAFKSTPGNVKKHEWLTSLCTKRLLSSAAFLGLGATHGQTAVMQTFSPSHACDTQEDANARRHKSTCAIRPFLFSLFQPCTIKKINE